MKKKFLQILASLSFMVATNYANQASPIRWYSPKVPKQVKSLRKF